MFGTQKKEEIDSLAHTMSFIFIFHKSNTAYANSTWAVPMLTYHTSSPPEMLFK